LSAWIRISTVGSRSIVAALLLAVIGAGSFPGARIAAADPVAPPPTLFVADGPFVRHPLVQLGVMQQGGYGGTVIERRVSNEPTVADGVLVNGQAAAELGPWTLASGPDGPRTIHAQLHYASGLWSPIATLDVVLDTAPESSLYVDLDPQPGLGYEIHLPPGADWHTRSTSADTAISGRVQPAGTPPTGFSVGDDRWSVYFYNQGGPVAPGTYDVATPVEEVSCGPICAGVVASNTTGCAGGGTFTIHEVSFTPDGDLESVAADFRLLCFSWLMSGSIRYGSSRGTIAIDQSADVLTFGSAGIGSQSEPAPVTFTNFGSAPADLGTAQVSGSAPPDFAIATDTCSNVTLAVGDSCQVGVRFTPQGLGNRFAELTIPDDTMRGSRSVRLIGSGLVSTSLSIATPDLPVFGPAPTTIKVTIAPDAGSPLLFVDGVQQYGPSDQLLSNPVRRVFTYSPVLAPGPHVATATFETANFYLGSSAEPHAFQVGTKTFLSFETAFGDGVIAGEPVELIATLWPGAPLTGGTLWIRDDASNEIVASSAVSGANPSLSHTVTLDVGTHPYVAEFVPASADVQPASTELDVVAVEGIRPETVMSSTTLVTNWGETFTEFSSPDTGATFECQRGVSPWYACTSPTILHANNPGTYQIRVRAKAANGLADRTPATRAWIVDQAPPVGAVSVAGGATTTRTAAVTLDVAATDGSWVTDVALSNDGATWTTRPYSPSQSWTLACGGGTRTVHAKWKDAAGNWSAASTDTIVLDAVLPTTSAPGRSFVAGTALSAGKVPVRLTWSGADATSGVASYELSQSTDGAAWTTVSATLTSGSLNRPLSAGHSYRFRVRATDAAGNVGGWAYGSTFRVSGYQEGNAHLKYAGSWGTSTSTAWWGGKARASSSPGATVKMTFAGRSFAWVGLTAKTRGKARVYVNGVLKATIDLYSATTEAQRLVWTASWSTSATRTVTIKVVGTSGRPRIDVDAFLVGT
jgi:hypothetical protein